MISMDFTTGFPTTIQQHDSIMVVVDKLSKASHFVPIKSIHKASDIAQIFMKEFSNYMVFQNQSYQIETLSSPQTYGRVCSRI